MATQAPQAYIPINNNTNALIYNFKLSYPTASELSLESLARSFRFYYQVAAYNANANVQLRSGYVDVSAVMTPSGTSRSDVNHVTKCFSYTSGTLTVTFTASRGVGASLYESYDLFINANSSLTSPTLRVSGVIVDTSNGTMYPPTRWY